MNTTRKTAGGTASALWIGTLALAFVAALVGPGAPPLAHADEAGDILKKFDALMAPMFFEGKISMTAHREDGTTRTYDMRILKGSDDKFRGIFDGPAAVKGQEVLRVGDNSWVYMPSLKKAV